MPSHFAHPHKAQCYKQGSGVPPYVSHIGHCWHIHHPSPLVPLYQKVLVFWGQTWGRRFLRAQPLRVAHSEVLSGSGDQVCTAWKILDFRFLPNLAALQGTLLSTTNTRTLNEHRFGRKKQNAKWKLSAHSSLFLMTEKPLFIHSAKATNLRIILNFFLSLICYNIQSTSLLTPLRNISSIQPLLATSSASTSVQMPIVSYLDYCSPN